MSNWLPTDLWTEILVSLPAKSLLRFQCVSKSWKSLISSPRFIYMHTEHSESTDNYGHLLHWTHYEHTVKQYQLFHDDGSLREFQELEYPSQIRGRDYQVYDCKGLILFTPKWEYKNHHGFDPLILWNPAIRMSMTLPRPCVDVPVGKYVVHGFGFDHTSNDYKVLRMVFDWNLRLPPRAELYKLHTGVWETGRGVNNFQYAPCTSATQALVNGASHWLGFHKRDMGLGNVVVLFHMGDEELRVMKLSDHLSSLHRDGIDLGVFGGLLSLMEFNRGQYNNLNCNVWLMKKYGVVESWTKQFTIETNNWSSCSMFSFRNNEKIVGEMNNEKIEGEIQNDQVLYDPKTHTFSNLGIKAKGFLFAKSTYVESLVLHNK